MGFDAVDKQFRAPEPIRLECEFCHSVDGVAMENTDIQFPEADGPEAALCRACALGYQKYWAIVKYQRTGYMSE